MSEQYIKENEYADFVDLRIETLGCSFCDFNQRRFFETKMKLLRVLACVLVVPFISLLSRNALAEDCQCNHERSKLFDHHSGMAITPDKYLTSMMSPWILHDYIRPWRHLGSLERDIGSTIKTDKHKFQISLDVQHFSPDEISVRTADGYVIVEAKHEEKKDEHGLVSRQFVRKYSLPEGAESENIVSELSTDGILTVTAPRKVIDDKGERLVPITHTGPARKEAKDTKADNPVSCEASDHSCNKI